MDLSVYISELLNERGTISIPGIGMFKQVRKRGYYNAEEGKLYPPYFATEFEQNAATDDTLLQYLIEKSKVSASSAKYFLDRYVHNILQQAEIGEAMIGNLGWLSKEVDTIHFRSAGNVSDASAAFGFAPVSIGNDEPQANEVTKPAAPESTPVESTVTTVNPAAGPAPVEPTPVTFSIEKELAKTPEAIMEEQPAPASQPKVPISPLVRQPKPVPAKPVVTEPLPEPLQPEPVVSNTSEPTVAESEAPVRPFYLRLPFYLGLTLIIAAAGIIFLLKSTANDKGTHTGNKSEKPTPSMDSVVVKSSAPADTVVIKAPAATDTIIRNTALPESTEFAPEVETPPATATHPVVNANNYKFVLVGGSYGTYELANAACNRYKAVGISASPFENSRKLFKVALGYYKTYTEGQQAKRELVKQGKVLNWKLYVETLRK